MQLLFNHVPLIAFHEIQFGINLKGKLNFTNNSYALQASHVKIIN